MATRNLATSIQSRFHFRRGLATTAENDEDDHDAKRQKTSTEKPDESTVSTQSTTFDRPLPGSDDSTLETEVIVIKDEPDDHDDEIDIAGKPQNTESGQPVNKNATPAQQPATLTTMESLELAEKYVDKYAGAKTQELEQKLRDFAGQSSA